jgi:hypothetical protein
VYCKIIQTRVPFILLLLENVTLTQAKATDELGPAAVKGDLATVQDCVAKGANVDAQTSDVRGTLSCTICRSCSFMKSFKTSFCHVYSHITFQYTVNCGNAVLVSAPKSALIRSLF